MKLKTAHRRRLGKLAGGVALVAITVSGPALLIQPSAEAAVQRRTPTTAERVTPAVAAIPAAETPDRDGPRQAPPGPPPGGGGGGGGFTPPPPPPPPPGGGGGGGRLTPPPPPPPPPPPGACGGRRLPAP